MAIWFDKLAGLFVLNGFIIIATLSLLESVNGLLLLWLDTKLDGVILLILVVAPVFRGILDDLLIMLLPFKIEFDEELSVVVAVDEEDELDDTPLMFVELIAALVDLAADGFKIIFVVDVVVG